MSLQEDARPAEGALHRARREGYGPGEFVDQHGFMGAREIVELAVRAGAGPGTSVLDLCCGPGGPGRLITAELGCDYLGLDASDTAVAAARERGATGARFEVRRVPPVPAGPFDVVLLLETMLAFRDKQPLLDQVRAALTDGGRFAFSAEVGAPLTPAERDVMPAPDTVWPVQLTDLHDLLRRAGLEVTWQEERSSAHQAVVDSLLGAFAAEQTAIAAQVGPDVLDDLLTAHRLWSTWLSTGRVRKFLLVARRSPAT